MTCIPTLKKLYKFNDFSERKIIIHNKNQIMNKKYLIGLVALTFALSMNYRYATNDYGILENALLAHVQASSSSSTSSSSNNPNANCWNLPNNHNGGNIHVYCDKKGDPKKCVLYKHIDTSGAIEWSESDKLGGTFTYTGIKQDGVRESCPKNGIGCTVYSCHATP